MQELQKTIDAETSRREEAAARAATLAVTVGELTELVRNREQALDQKQAEVTKQPVVELSPRACKHLSTFLSRGIPMNAACSLLLLRKYLQAVRASGSKVTLWPRRSSRLIKDRRMRFTSIRSK